MSAELYGSDIVPATAERFVPGSRLMVRLCVVDVEASPSDEPEITDCGHVTVVEHVSDPEQLRGIPIIPDEDARVFRSSGSGPMSLARGFVDRPGFWGDHRVAKTTWLFHVDSVPGDNTA
jgi:hypothetical protein